MAQAQLRPGKNTSETDGPESPEALFISALLDSGTFNPEAYRITAEHLSCWDKLFAFCVEYQLRSGVAPPLSLVSSKFPGYEMREGLNQGWAASELHKAHSSRQLRFKLRAAIAQLDQGDLDAAYTELEQLSRPRSVRRKPASIFDHHLHEEHFDVPSIPVPYQTLGRVTGGIYPADLWYLAGRPGTGKTWNLCAYAALAVSQGCRVKYLSLEMRSDRIGMRALKCMANTKELTVLNDPGKDREALKRTLDSIKDRMSGTFDVVDPSHGRVTTNVVREHMDECDLLIVDHAGLLITADGRRAIDDWRAMALISNMLKEYALETSVPVVAGAQLNRTADTASPRPPKLSQLAQSDALGQDADVVVTMKRLSKHVMVQSAEKVREGEGMLWYSKFDPSKADFGEMKKDAALEFMASDEDLEVDNG